MPVSANSDIVNIDSTRPSVAALLANPEYADFVSDSFDAVEYANRIIQAPQGKTFHRTDIAAALAKLSFSIEHLNKELHNQVAEHYEDLLEQVTGLDHLEVALEKIREGIISTNTSFNRVKSKIRDTYGQIKAQTDELELVQAGTDLLRHIQKFLGLVRRLESYMNDGETAGITQAAGCVKEIETLLTEVDLNGISVVDPEIPKVKAAKASIITLGDKNLSDGLNSQNQVDIASGLQVFYNLHQISEKTKNVLDNILGILSKETQSALNVHTLNKEIKDVHAQTALGKKGVEIVNVSGPVYTEKLWKRLESLMDTLHDSTVKVYVLEKVLSRKRDPITQATYLDHVIQGMDENVVKYYWKSVSLLFEKEIRSAVKSSTFFQQIFQIGYPKLLRLFHDMFSRLNVTITAVPAPSSLGTASTVLQQRAQPQPSTVKTETQVSVERVAAESAILLKALSSFETAYLRESLARLLEPVNQAFPEKPATARSSATKDDVEKLLGAISRELEISKFDPHLLKSVAKNAAKAINMFTIRSEHALPSDSSVFAVPAATSTAVAATTSQLINIDIINCLWALADGVWKELDEFEGEQAGIVVTLTEAVENVHKLIQSVAESFIAGIAREIELSFLKIHKEDFNRISKAAAADQSLSQYVIEVGGKMRWVQREIMMRLSCGDDSKDWYKAVGMRLIDFFLRQASIIRPLNTEQGKLKLTTDMTQLEFILNQWTAPTGLKLEAAMGASYKALRAFRQLLFLDTNQIAAMHHTADIPKILVAHHLIVRAHPLIHLPVTAFGWNELTYSNWLDVHTENEAVALLGQCLNMYMEDVRKQGGREYRVEFVVVRNLLKLS